MKLPVVSPHEASGPVNEEGELPGGSLNVKHALATAASDPVELIGDEIPFVVSSEYELLLASAAIGGCGYPEGDHAGDSSGVAA